MIDLRWLDSFANIESPFFRLNESRAAAKGEIGPGPLEHDQQTILEAGQVVDVDDQPCHPGEKSYARQSSTHCG